MNLMELAKERTDTINELEEMKNVITKENRALNTEEIEKVEKLKAKLDGLQQSIRLLEESIDWKSSKATDLIEQRTFNDRLNRLDNHETLDLAEFRAKGIAMTETDKNGGADKTTPLSSTAKNSFADEIIKLATQTSGLFDAVKKVTLPSALHKIPVARKGLSRLVGVQELEEYTRDAFKIEPVILEPQKLGSVLGVSKELIKDYGYDIEGYILGLFNDAFKETLDHIIVKGATIGNYKIEGLESFDPTTDGSHKFEIDGNKIDIDALTEMYYTLPSVYRGSATWVISDKVARILTGLKDANGNPLLFPSYSVAPFGSRYTLFGRPVIVNSYVDEDVTTEDKKIIYFGDLSRAIVFGIRDTLELAKSTEVGFIRDEILIKAMTRIDIKKLQTDAMVVGVTKTTATTKSTQSKTQE